MSRRKNFIEQTNPLRGLTPATVVSYLEAGQRGELPMLMWLYHIIEQSDPDLLALVERRISAVCEMDWNIGSAPGAETEDGKRKAEEGAAETPMTRAQFNSERSRLRAGSLHVHAAGGGCGARQINTTSGMRVKENQRCGFTP